MGREFTIQRGPTRVCFGLGAARRIADEVVNVGASRVLVVCTLGRIEDGEAIAARLGSLSVGVLAIAKEHVPRAIALDARRAAESSNADAVLAFGGGSAIGLAKAVALEGHARVLAIPSTYSGSEMTPIYGITESNEKKTGRDERVRPVLVIYDPELTFALPRETTIASLWNAIAHAVEAMWAKNVDPIAIVTAERALGLLASSVARLDADPSDHAAREDALEGAYLAGAVFGDVGSGLHHKLCHELGGAFDLPHAATHAALLPHVVRFQRDREPAAMRAMASALGVVDPVLAVDRLARATGVTRSLEKLGMPREGIARFASTPDRLAIVTAAWPEPPAGIAASAVRMPSSAPMKSGFGSTHESEALDGALPRTQNAPRRAPYGLYPELLNGTPFTVESRENSRVWMYRVRPSFSQSAFTPLPRVSLAAALEDVLPNRTRWRTLPIPPTSSPVDVLDGMVTLGGAGDPMSGPGYRVHLYAANTSMVDRCFSNADGDLLFVPQEGTLECRTELGWLRVSPGSVLLVPRALKFSLELPDASARGWVLEVFGRSLRLPERGLIGSNGLADARHFLAPTASFEDRIVSSGFQHVTKLGGRMFAATQEHSPFDVVAWHGNHVPYSYDLSLFAPMGSLRFDHQDPSIFTVLTAPLDDHGRAIADFVVFPPRWEVIEHSFRPPFMHRNAASEVNMVVRNASPGGVYEAGCTFLSPLLSAHGVTTKTYDDILSKPDDAIDPPQRIPDASLWAMLESALPFCGTAWARETPLLDASFLALFEGMRSRFDPNRR